MLKKVAFLFVFAAVTGIVMAALLFALQNPLGQKSNVAQLSYSQFIQAVNEGGVKQVELDSGNLVIGSFHNGGRFATYRPADPHLIDDLLKRNVEISAKPESYFTLEWLLAVFISIWVPMMMQTFILVLRFKQVRR
jgi:cell division protease FtsH